MKPAVLAGSMALPVEAVDMPALKRALTAKYQPMGEEEALQLEMFKQVGGMIHVPRQFGLDLCTRQKLAYVDQTSAGEPVKFPAIPKPRDYQVEPLLLMQEACGDYYDYIFRARTGWGKCQAKGTRILMYDGSVKKVEDVAVGDLLMGPDSTPRTVLSLACGREEMFTVTPTKGDAQTFNRSHVLSLRATATDGVVRKGDVVNVSINDYISWSKKRKHLFKLWRTGVDFPEASKLPYDPHFVGLYLGDGTKSTNVTLNFGKGETTLVDYVYEFAEQHGFRVREHTERGCTQVHLHGLSKHFREFIQVSLTTDVYERRIPQEYLAASRKDRLSLLAGIIDSDGHLYGNCYDFIAKDKVFAEQVCFLARSLGLAAYLSPCQKKAQTWANTKTYYRVKISGNVDSIPVLSLRKRAAPRQQKKDVLVTGFTVKSSGIGDYYGFTLDGDHLYVLGDFTVTHNTIGSLILAARIGVTTLIVVDQETLKAQWIDALIAHFGFTREEVGIIQGKRCDYEGKAVTVAMIQTLRNKPDNHPLHRYFGLALFDEVHIIGAPSFSTVLPRIAASYRVGVSATPKRRDGLQKVLNYHLGKVRVYIDDEHAKSSVYITSHDSIYSWYANTAPKIGRFINEISEDGSRNLLVAESAVYLYETGRDVLVLSDRIEHLRGLMDLCFYLGVPDEEMGIFAGYSPVYGYAKNPKPLRHPQGYERKTEYTPVSLQLISKRISKKELSHTKDNAKLLFATYGMFAKGVDVPRLSGGVDATPRSQAEQVHGRILRKVEGKLRSIWITIVDSNSYRSVFSLTSRLSGYNTNNADLFEGDLEQGWTKCNAKELKARNLEKVARLKSMRIETDSDGLNTLVTPQQVMQSVRTRAISTIAKAVRRAPPPS